MKSITPVIKPYKTRMNAIPIIHSIALFLKSDNMLIRNIMDIIVKDEDVKKILTNFVDAYSEIMEEAGEKETAKEMSEAIDQIYDNIDELVDEIDEIEFDGKIELVVYATTNKVYRTDINIDVDTIKNLRQHRISAFVMRTTCAVTNDSLSLPRKPACYGKA